MNGHRVVITGLGVISGLGRSVPEFWQQIVEGKTGIGPLQSVDTTRIRFKNGCEVKNFVPAEYFEKKELAILDKFAQFSLIAAKEAVTDAGIQWTDELRKRTCVIT